jgi:hypothetical protein
LEILTFKAMARRIEGAAVVRCSNSKSLLWGRSSSEKLHGGGHPRHFPTSIPTSYQMLESEFLIHSLAASVASDFGHPTQPNKAPEPTTRSVTPRAFLRISEMKLQTRNRHAARVAPERVVAHL